LIFEEYRQGARKIFLEINQEKKNKYMIIQGIKRSGGV
jgi:hypothetical protein